MDEIFESSTENRLQESLASITERMFSEYEKITEFKTHELYAISFLQTDPFLSEYLDFLLQNKKHIKRKYASELLEAIRAIAQFFGGMIGLNNGQGKSGGLFR